MSQTSTRPPVNIRELNRRCKQAGLDSRRKLAAAVSDAGTSLTHAAIVRWTTRAANPSAEKIAGVAFVLDCEPDDLLLKGRRP